jgi:hypothetical protein
MLLVITITPTNSLSDFKFKAESPAELVQVLKRFLLSLLSAVPGIAQDPRGKILLQYTPKTWG